MFFACFCFVVFVVFYVERPGGSHKALDGKKCFVVFVLVLFGFLLGQLPGLRTGPLPALLWLSTS